MARAFGIPVMNQHLALRWWNAFTPQQPLSLAPVASPVVNRFDAGILPDQALARVVANASRLVRTSGGNVKIPAGFVPPADAAVDRQPPTAQATQALIESGTAYTNNHRGNRDTAAGISYACSALTSGVIVHYYDGDLAVASHNYERLFARYRTQVDQIVNIYVRKCRGRFRESFYSAALEGVLYAIRTYDGSKGRFAPWLIQNVHYSINKIAPEVLGVTQSMMDIFYTMRKARARFGKTYHRDPERAELRFVLGVTQSRFNLMRDYERKVYHAYRGLSFDESYMGVSTSREVYAAIGNDTETYERARSAFEGAANLTERQRQVVQRFYFDPDMPSFTVIGHEQGVCCAAIGERMKGAMEKLAQYAPGIRRDFESIRPHIKRTKEMRARAAAKKRLKQQRARATAARRFVAAMLEPGYSTTNNFFSSVLYREILWDLTFQERRVLQYRLEGNDDEDIARLEDGTLTADEAGAIFRTVLGTLVARRMLLDKPEATATEIAPAVKSVDEKIAISDYITGGESFTYLTDHPKEFKLLLSLLTDKQREAMELHLTGLLLIEIGARMGNVFPQVIHEHLAHARDKLKGHWNVIQILRSHGMPITRDAILFHEVRAGLSNYITNDGDASYIYKQPEEFALLVSLLTDKQREVIESQVAGLTEVLIAERMGVFPQVVHGHIVTARSELRAFLRIIRFLESRSIVVTREEVLAYPFNVELSNFLTDDQDPHYVYAEEFERLCDTLSEDQLAVLRYKQFKNPRLADTVPRGNIKTRYQRVKHRLKRARSFSF